MRADCRLSLKGEVFGRLTVLDYAYTDKHGKTMWKCKCECGNEVVVVGSHLKNGHTQSCGCIQKESIIKWSQKHGKRHTRLYYVWLDMKTRCENPKVNSYKNYGGRGVKICEAWRNSFQAFHDWAMSNGYDPNAKRGDCTLDRIDVNGNYCPDNCRWVDMKVQNSNKRKGGGRNESLSV